MKLTIWNSLSGRNAVDKHNKATDLEWNQINDSIKNLTDKKNKLNMEFRVSKGQSSGSKWRDSIDDLDESIAREIVNRNRLAQDRKTYKGELTKRALIAGGIGLAGYGGYKLYKHLKNKRKFASEKDRKAIEFLEKNPEYLDYFDN